jgi:hypothetical protein
MMTLQQAARFFDDQTFTDTNGTSTFLGQILPFSDSVRSGAATRRRILDVAADVTVPDKKTVTEAAGQIYILAAENRDYFRGEVIRSKYPVIPVTDTYSLRDIGQVLAASGGTTGVYVAPSYIRRVSAEDQADYTGGFMLYMSSYYSVVAGIIIYKSGDYYRVRATSHTDDIGFAVAEAVYLDDPVSTATVQQKGTVRNPATGNYNDPAALTDIDIFSEHIDLDYHHEALGFVDLAAGDLAISFLKSAVSTITPGASVGDYLVKAVSDHTTFWTIHGRKI